MCHNAFCNLTSDWIPFPSVDRVLEPFSHLHLTLGRGNISKQKILLLRVLQVVILSILSTCLSSCLYMEKKKYNLRSTKSDTLQIALQVHLSDDNFLTNLLGSDKSDMSHQGPVSRSLPWKGPPLVKEGVFFLWEGHLKIQFHKASFNSPYQRSSLNLKEGANVLP